MADGSGKPAKPPTAPRESRRSRREFLQGVAGVGATVAGLAVGTGPAEASAREPRRRDAQRFMRAGILFGGTAQPFHQGGIRLLETNGIEVTREYAGGEFCSGVLYSHATALLQRNIDVLITTDSPGTLAALSARKDLNLGDNPPIVAAVIGNPVLDTTYGAFRIVSTSTGVVAASLQPVGPPDPQGPPGQGQGQHVPGLYGVALPQGDDAAKRLLILADAVGLRAAELGSGERTIARRATQPPTRPLVDIAFVTNFSNPGYQREWNQTQAAAIDYNLDDTRLVRVRLHLEGVSCRQDPGYDTPDVVRRMSRLPNLSGLLIIGDAASHRYRDALQDFADSYTPKLITMWESLGPVNTRGTLCWGPDRADAYEQAATIALNIILHGQYPPPEPTRTVRFTLYANQGVADSVGLGQVIRQPLDGTQVDHVIP